MDTHNKNTERGIILEKEEKQSEGAREVVEGQEEGDI